MLVIYGVGLFAFHQSDPQAGGLTTVICVHLLIQCICSYPPFLEALSNHNPKMCHAVVTTDPLDMEGKVVPLPN